MRENVAIACVHQCWAKSPTPIGNFLASYEPNQNFKILTDHFPISDNINGNMLRIYLTHTKSNNFF